MSSKSNLRAPTLYTDDFSFLTGVATKGNETTNSCKKEKDEAPDPCNATDSFLKV
jgi:hypothetical protein